MARPRPLPPVLDEAANGWNSVSRAAQGMPGPSSATVSDTHPIRGTAETSTRFAPPSSALRPRLSRTRSSSSRSPITVSPAGTALIQSPPLQPAVSAAPASATSSDSAMGRRRIDGAPVFANSTTRAARATARSSAANSVGVTRRTSGSPLSPRRSERSCAVARMLRRSWLIFVTASPSAASRARWCRAVRSASCMAASSASATPTSSCRPLGLMTRLASSGFSRNCIIARVRRDIGRTSSQRRLKNTRIAVISEMNSES